MPRADLEAAAALVAPDQAAPLLTLGASWRTPRCALLGAVPLHGVWAHAFPPEATE
jgi:hypothetical protein